ncbi:hypothetical protein Tco_1134080 [Tanacetum coccineum]
MDNNPRDNNVQQPPNQRQDAARSYTAGPSERKEYAGTLPLCNQIAKFDTTIGNQWHYRSECPRLKNQNYGNQTRNGEARGRVYALGGGEADQDPNDITDDIDA